MTASIVTWSQDMSNLGSATVAIGVFDGVHVGHQSLLRDTVADAVVRNVRSVAVTFDRDPDQVVSPSTAAPQLLTLEDKLRFISETGIDVILVVPFTPALAEMAPESFVDSTLLGATRPTCVHVGHDFRFGSRATGDIGTLQRLGLTHGFDVCPHDLVAAEGGAVTSTRIRALVATGDIPAAAELLGRSPRVAGTVRRGRGEGAKLGFPTANITPVPFAALPADGVYAGRAVLEDGVEWAAAISVGTPPTFPEARDYLEAHLLDFEGDLYDQTITLEFFQKLRDQLAYGSLEDLAEAIGDDVAATLEIAGFDEEDQPDDDGALVDDPAALAAAEAQVAAMEVGNPFAQIAGAWAPLLEGVEISEGPDAGPVAFMITSPLVVVGIPYAWDPGTPGNAPSAIRGRYPSTFALYVPEERLEEARSTLLAADSPYSATLAAAGALIASAGPLDTPVADTDAEDLDFDPVTDPAALEAAEQAVRDIGRGALRDPNDELIVLADDLPFDKPRLLGLEAALRAAGVESVWNPYPPHEAPLLRFALLGENRFRIEVWNSELELARCVLQEIAADS